MRPGGCFRVSAVWLGLRPQDKRFDGLHHQGLSDSNDTRVWCGVRTEMDSVSGAFCGG